MRIDVLTLFPDMFREVLATSMPGRAAASGAVEYQLHDLRDWTKDKHRTVDDRPFGGGPGMVMMCEPLCDAVHAVEAMEISPARRVLLTPQGEPLTQARVEELATESRLLLIAGHYEGIDERVIDELNPLEISIGDYVVSGGELPAMVLIDALVRLLPGVLGHADSAAEDSFSTRDESGRPLLDCPHFTRPRTWHDREVPDVLLSGDHGAIADWRREQSVERTRQRRPDLLDPTPRPLDGVHRSKSRQPDGGMSARGEHSGHGPGDSES
jgi:tRNA (guanine37-N1)-methyltransferase